MNVSRRPLRAAATAKLALTLAAILLGNSSPSQAAEAVAAAPPNILLIVSDDQRPDTIASLGNSVIRTPNLDRLRRN